MPDRRLSVKIVTKGDIYSVSFLVGKKVKYKVYMVVAFRAKCKMFSRHLQKPILKTEKGRFKGL